MSKADERDKGTGSEGSVKNAAETTPDVIPPVHVLEAAQQQERKETEDLLAGFDRPGRSPRRAVSGDFVDYYARKKSDRGGASNPSEKTTKPAAGRRDAETVIIPRKKETPAWVLWAGAAAVLVTLGGSVAYVATSDAPPSAPSVPSAATTITSALPVATQTSSVVDVPPPDPVATTNATPTVMTADPVATTVRTTPKPRASASASGYVSDIGNGSSSARAPATSASPPPSSSNGYIRTFPTP